MRRVVTGHNPEGLAIIRTDDVAQGDRFTLIWTTEGFPVDNAGATDGGKRDVGITLAGGTVFRVGEIAPGARSPMHRTYSVDYGIVLDGELDMEVNGGESVHLRLATLSFNVAPTTRGSTRALDRQRWPGL